MGLKVGVIGVGAISHPHLLAYSNSDKVDKIAIADIDAEAIIQASKSFHIDETFAEYREILDDSSVDVVDICLPHYLHCPVALEAFEAGKDVVTEKPIAITLEQADEMINSAKQNSKRLYVSHNMRFMPAHIKLKEMLDSGKIGKPFLAIFNIIGNEFGRMNVPDNWKGSWDKAGGGTLIDTGMHAVYMIQHFLGEPTKVTAVTRRLLVEPENKADDNSVVILEFQDNVIGNIVVTYTALAHPWQESRNIYGTEGSLHVKDTPRQTLTFVKGDKREEISVEELEYGPHGGSIVRSIEHFINCYVSDKPFETTPEEGRRALLTILKAYGKVISEKL